MAVLGIDPGSRRCGYGIVARAGPRLSRVRSGVIVLGAAPAAERLAVLYRTLAELLEGGAIEAVAVETAFCGRSPRSALALGQARGVALAASGRAGLPVYEYAPAEVKRAFAGNGRAEKSQMVRMARTLFAFDVELPDEADALAVAVCHLARSSSARASAPIPLHPASRRADAARAAVALARTGVLRAAVRSWREPA